MDENVRYLLDFAGGPLFRFAFALMVLGLLRVIALTISDTLAAYLTIEDRRIFWRRFRQHLMWFIFPSIIIRQARPGGSTSMFVFHLGLCVTSLIFRAIILVVPAFMMAHVYLWERGIGISWPALPAGVADVLTLVAIVAGLVLFLGRLYSPVLRGVEPAWSFLKPLILLLPFVTGMLAMHPTWSPIDYHVVLLIHILSAVLVFVLLPFTRMLSCMHTPLSRFVPEAVWLNPYTGATDGPAPAAEE
ncbi:MAG: hypothetical protein ABIG44_00025 [Planctomycetota bacterium]